MSKLKLTFISDTHAKHKSVDSFLEGGDILIHSGDFMTSGYNPKEAMMFFEWFDKIDNYSTKVFISGNHDRYMEDNPKEAQEILKKYKTIDYLEDNSINIDGDIILYGSPHQPEFYNWAFNLPRNGEELRNKWELIPDNVDILITHSPPMSYLDTSGHPYNEPNLGCELLKNRVELIKPKIHVFGHIHGSYGYRYNGDTHFINASILDERYIFRNKPLTILWDNKTNEIEFLNQSTLTL